MISPKVLSFIFICNGRANWLIIGYKNIYKRVITDECLIPRSLSSKVLNFPVLKNGVSGDPGPREVLRKYSMEIPVTLKLDTPE